ncbi:MAG: hypothetical protein COV95_02195 [Candidatus Zambryskibacteria bacterium CG11_big_fil_rev_8_21_14_0_20_40_24]|uniref:Uncharacterized protein n=1 Tax=Candidatus Zambryskibacteria bacterium CG11_big_fil_rev_8_21_14_0_20_40_24 TaxID=1975116 RepID=A0A2H0K6E8_9BACT|nr:MAG: hypothetical protein COV95_02195 [Candidatus Zambryskibacteria bacterium CG11_big_fil_rev_8_21_14_0_20_40_24]
MFQRAMFRYPRIYLCGIILGGFVVGVAMYLLLFAFFGNIRSQAMILTSTLVGVLWFLEKYCRFANAISVKEEGRSK